MEQKDERDLKQLKILIAEDDAVNQLVAKIVFKQIGCSYDLAENGLEAIKMMEQSNYDVVLLDIEMPEMNGYDTALKIRKDFKSPKAEVPIIAITAHISEPELKKCLDVGMNGYIFKPLKLNDLVQKLNSILGESTEPEPVKTDSSERPDSVKLFDLKNLLASCGNNATIVNNVAKLFIEQTPGNLAMLQEHLQKKNWEDLKNLSHKIKAVYALIGAEEIRSYLHEIEDDCSKNNIDVPKFEQKINLVRSLSATLLKALQEKVLNNNFG